MKRRAEWLDLRHQRVAKPLAGDVRQSRDVVDRLLRIKLRALATDLVEDVEYVRLHVEQAKLEYREQPAWSGTDDQHVGLDRFAHAILVRLSRHGRTCSDHPRLWMRRKQDADARHKAGHDELLLIRLDGASSVYGSSIWDADLRMCSGATRYACRSGVRTTRPSSSAVTLI